MPIRVPRTTLQQDPGRRVNTGSVVASPAIGNPAAAAVRPAQQLAGLAAELFQHERDREIETRVLELDIDRRRTDAEVLNRYKQAQGKDAVEQREAAVAEILQNGKRVRTGITDRTVASLWKRQDAALTYAATAELDDHYRRQRAKWEADTQEARADLLVNDLGRVAFGEGYDPATGRLSDEAERTRSSYLDTIGELGSVLGWSSEQVERTRQKADTAAFGQVAQSLISEERFDEASRVLERHGERIDVGLRVRLARDVRVGRSALAEREVTRQRAEKAQLWTLRAADIAAERGGTITEQRAYALDTAEASLRGGRLTTEEYDAVLQRLDRHYRIADENEAAEGKQVITDAERWLNENPLNTLQDNPRLFEAVKRAGALKGVLEFERSGRYSTDPEVLARARAMPDEVLRETPSDRLWVTLRPHLSNGDLDDVMARQARVLGTATAAQLQVISMTDRLEKTARELGILPKNPLQRRSPVQQQEFDAWRFRFNTDLQVWQDRTGKKATPEDVQRMLDLQVRDEVEVVNKGLIWDTTSKTPLARLSDRQTASLVIGTERVQLKRLPEATWSQIAAFLAEKGIEPTARNIAERWVAIGRPGDLEPAGVR